MSIRFGGRVNIDDVGVGNKLFLYFAAIIHHYNNGTRVIADGRSPMKKIRALIKIVSNDVTHNLYYKTTPKNPGPSKNIPSVYNKETNELIYLGEGNTHVFSSYYHNTSNIVKHEELVRSCLDLEFFKKDALKEISFTVEPDDVLCSIRIGDFIRNNLIHPDYYLSILREKSRNGKLGKIYLSIFNNYEGLTEKYVSFFKEFDDKIVVLTNNNEHHDFYLPSLFKTIIVSNSTFHWWSTFLNGKNSISTYIPSDFGILKPEMFPSTETRNITLISSLD